MAGECCWLTRCHPGCVGAFKSKYDYDQQVQSVYDQTRRNTSNEPLTFLVLGGVVLVAGLALLGILLTGDDKRVAFELGVILPLFGLGIMSPVLVPVLVHPLLIKRSLGKGLDVPAWTLVDAKVGRKALEELTKQLSPTELESVLVLALSFEGSAAELVHAVRALEG